MERILLSSAFLTALAVILSLTALPAEPIGDLEERERLGLELHEGYAYTPMEPAPRSAEGLRSPVLLIPESIADTVGMYDPHDGTYLGDLIKNSSFLGTPINAVFGPDGDIYVSDQTSNAIFVYDPRGGFLYTYADASDGLYNVRGIDFRDGHLFVTSGDDCVAEFDGPHSRLADFINDGSDPFDILFLPDGRALLSDIEGHDDNVRLYNADGTLDREFFKVTFPEQLARDTIVPGLCLNTAFSGKRSTDFDLGGEIHQTTNLSASSRGAFRLWNGNLLITDSYGVWEIDQDSGDVIDQKNSGSFRYIELVSASDLLRADAVALSASAGGVINFDLATFPCYAGRDYALLGSMSGTEPGFLLRNAGLLPLNPDIFSYFIRNNFNSTWFAGFRGILDSDGNASAVLDSGGPVPAIMPVGTTLHFAFTTIYPFDVQSNAVSVTVVP